MNRSRESDEAHGEENSADRFDQTASSGYGPASDYFDLMSAMSPEDISNAFRDAIGDETTIRVVELMSRAYMTWMNQGLSYWGALAERQSHYGAALMSRLSAIRDNPELLDCQRRELIDEAQRYLREITELTMREGRVLQRDFEHLASELQAHYSDSLPDGQRRRFGSIKP